MNVAIKRAENEARFDYPESRQRWTKSRRKVASKREQRELAHYAEREQLKPKVKSVAKRSLTSSPSARSARIYPELVEGRKRDLPISVV